MGIKFKIQFLILLCFIKGGVLFGQVSDSLQYDLSTPRQAFITHFQYLQENNYHPSIAAKAFKKSNSSQEELIDLSIKVKQIFDGKGIYLEEKEIPDSSDYVNSTNNRARYTLHPEYPRIYLEKTDGKWQYPPEIADNIRNIHNDVYPFGIAELMNLVPKMGGKAFAGLYIWQWIGILIFITASIIFYLVFIFVFEFIIHRIIVRMGYKDVAQKHLYPIAKPMSLVLVFFMLTLFIPVLQFPIEVGRYVITGLKAVIPILWVLVFYRLADLINIYLTKLAYKTENTLDDQLIPLIRKVLKTLIVIIGGMMVLANIGYNITTLLTGISIGGLAFALAAQDTIKNFFGSLMIFIDKPFQIGDWIISGEIEGVVEEVGLRSTRVRTFANSLVSVPNGKLADATVDNYGLRQYRRFSTQIAITYDTPATLIEIFVEGLRRIVANHPETRKDFYEIKFNNMGEFSLNIMFYIFFEVPTWSDELRCRHEILLQIVKLAEELGVRFAFPTQTLHMETFPGQNELSPHYETDMKTLKAKLEDFLNKES